MVERRIHAMHKKYGICWGLTCKDCAHLKRYEYHGRVYYKCELYGQSHSEASDWRLSWIACGMNNMPVNMNIWVPLADQINHGKKQDKPLDGQMRMEE